MSPDQLDLIAGWVAFVLTLMVFSYLLADNFLYRIAVHILVGAAAAYIAITAVVDVIIPWVDATVLADANDSTITMPVRAMGMLPIVIALMLLLKSSPRLAYIGNFGMLVVVAIGTGVALVGATIGTIIPEIRASGQSIDREETLNGVLLILGTISTLAYFQYISRKRPTDEVAVPILPIRILGTIGQGFIVITLGALYAQAILTSMTIFDGLIRTQIEFLLQRIGG